MEGYLYANQSHTARWGILYFLPHGSTNLIHTGKDVSVLKSHKICTDTLLAVIGISRKRMSPIIKVFL